MTGIRLPIFAVLVAIVITTTMDFTGFFMLSALPLAALILVFWLLRRQSRSEIGLALGHPRHYGLALLYPLCVLGAAALAAYLAGDISTASADWGKVGINMAAGSTIGILVLILTEEGFFRGWVWGAVRRAGVETDRTLLVTSVLFTLWHVSAVLSPTDYGLPWPQIPVYLANVTLLGLIWGLLRQISGSIVVASVSHAAWNAVAYELFGFGTKVGALGVENTAVFGPEVGYLGILLNLGFFLWLRSRAARDEASAAG